MPPRRVRASAIPPEPPVDHVPLLPTIVVSCFKGGVWKTSLAVAMAERLAWAGLRVVLLTCDPQEDARSRLGHRGSSEMLLNQNCGSGSLTTAGAQQAVALDLVYRKGPERLGIGTFDIAILDTPPMEMGGNLSGVYLVVPMDGEDAVRNAATMLRHTPASTDIMLVRVVDLNQAEWEEDMNAIYGVLGREVEFLEGPLPFSPEVKAAHRRGQSVWTLEREGATRVFLSGVEELAHRTWVRYFSRRPWPAMPILSQQQQIRFSGWK